MLLSRAVIDALLPGGSLWTVEDGGGLDQLLEGIAECLEPARAEMKALALMRNPLYTNMLPDLEREYGVIPRITADDATRRANLAAVKSAGSIDGSLSALQSVLDSAGFSVQVHANNPPVDPGLFILYQPSAIFGNNNASFGASAFGAQRGELLVNGPVYYNQAEVRYEIPADAGYWPLFFFVSGDATRGGSGELTALADAEVPVARRAELRNLILRCKPMHSWAGLRIQYV